MEEGAAHAERQARKKAGADIDLRGERAAAAAIGRDALTHAANLADRGRQAVRRQHALSGTRAKVVQRTLQCPPEGRRAEGLDVGED